MSDNLCSRHNYILPGHQNILSMKNLLNIPPPPSIFKVPLTEIPFYTFFISLYVKCIHIQYLTYY